jgi:hypothetical protein
LFSDVAGELLALGVERRTVINDLGDTSCPIDEAFVKEVWRAIQFTQTGKKSTTELSNSEVSRVYDTFNKFLGETYHLHLPWPCAETMMEAWEDLELVVK